MPRFITRRSVLGAALAAAALPSLTRAQAAYPTHQVRLIVPFAPAGSTDILARLIATDFFPAAHQTAVVENLPGAGGNIGQRFVAKSPPDGYTLEIGAMSGHAMNGSLYRDLPFDAMNDFTTIAMLAYAINVIAVGPSIPVNTFPELLAYIRANPGKVNYASGGIGTHNHLTMAYLAKTAHLDIVHVPYKGGGPAVAALVQGECNLFAGGASLLLPHAKAGEIKLLAVTEATRSDLLPNIPSVSEILKGFEVTNWYGVFGPKGMDPARVDTINADINRFTGTPMMTDRLKQLGMVRAPVSPQRLHDILEADYRQWSTTITALGITAG